jgi:hypothetical protein
MHGAARFEACLATVCSGFGVLLYGMSYVHRRRG